MKDKNANIPSIPQERVEIARQIKLIREEKGLSQEDLAQIMGVSRTTISKIENGRFSFSIDYLLKLSASLDFNIILKRN